ncbi:MAG: hypothetical protein HRT87_04165 [Legionellales bacterium]|nr:hypothetical protein [Legionellales bacterium]
MMARNVKRPNLIWPILPGEYKRVFLIFLMFFLSTFVYHILRNMKVALVVTLKGSGANVIPFLKIFCVLPSAVFVTYIFTKLVTKFNRVTVFYYMMCAFIAYFILFSCILYPYQEIFELDKISSYLKESIFLTSGLDGLLVIIRHWNMALFYIVSELWSTFILSVLLWGFVNEITNMNDAKRFYPIFNMGINGSGIFMGLIATWMISLDYPNILSYTDKDIWIFYQLIVASIIGGLILSIFFYLNNSVIASDVSTNQTSALKERTVISFKQAIYSLKHSKFLIFLVFIVLSYNIVFNLADVVWVHRVKLAYTNSKDYYGFMNKVTFMTGIIATLMDGLITGIIIRKYGWKLSALTTPFIWFTTGILFYSGIVFEEVLFSDIIIAWFGNPANIILIIGTLQIVLGRSFKYTIFDATKEMVFIPLSKKEKRESKAVIDGIITRLGKSFGSMFYILMLIILGELSLIIPYVFVLIVFLVILWGFSVIKLNTAVKGLSDPYSGKIG